VSLTDAWLFGRPTASAVSLTDARRVAAGAHFTLSPGGSQITLNTVDQSDCFQGNPAASDYAQYT